MKCNRCGELLRDGDLVGWKCNTCGKAFKINIAKLDQFQKRKITQNNSGSILKCPSCGNWMDDGNEKILVKCGSCGNVMQGNLTYFTSSVSNTEIADYTKLTQCPDCGKMISKKAAACPFCGCPLIVSSYSPNMLTDKTRKNFKKILIPIIALTLVIAIISSIYYIKVTKPKNTYNEAMTLLENGEYEEANELFNTIQDYNDVSIVQEQLKYESYAYSTINSVKEYLKNPESFQLYDVSFYQRMADDGSDITNTSDFPVCIMRFTAQNGFGGNTSSYTIAYYNTDIQQYKIVGICDSLDINDYDSSDEDELLEMLTCILVNSYNDRETQTGNVDIDRLKTVLKNDTYSAIKIIGK